jgi:bacteriorhodopsin
MACLAYLGMAMNQGTYDIGDRTVYWARYLDWFITTPLILFSLTRLSGVRATMIAGAIIANQFMIGTGFVATMSTGSQKWVWYIVSCAFMLAIYAILLGPVFNASRRMHHQVHNLFTTAIAIFGTYYLAYPIVWILGEKGFGIYGVPLETFLIMILDIIAKVVYAFVLLRDQEALDKRSELESKYS